MQWYSKAEKRLDEEQNKKFRTPPAPPRSHYVSD